jgi:hypothetical protein
MHSGASSGFASMNPMPENVQASRIGFHPQMLDPQYAGEGMGMGIDNMDLDPIASNLWWDQPFDTIPTEQYGVWYPEAYQGADVSGF